MQAMPHVRRSTLTLLLALIVAACGADSQPETAPPEIDEGNFVSREGVNVEFAMRPVRSEKTGLPIRSRFKNAALLSRLCH